jgi:hypothetical protein
VFHGERVAEAPDLVVGYNRTYAGSDPSTLGEVTEAVLEDNTSRWSGNHLIDPRLVPGVSSPATSPAATTGSPT